MLWVCDYFTFWSLASSLFTGTEQSLWCRPCSRWLRWRFSAWWPLVKLETAVALLQRLFRAGACTRTNHVFATMRSLQCNQCQDSMRQINPNGFQSVLFYVWLWFCCNKHLWVELSWVEYIIWHNRNSTGTSLLSYRELGTHAGKWLYISAHIRSWTNIPLASNHTANVILFRSTIVSVYIQEQTRAEWMFKNTKKNINKKSEIFWCHFLHH